VQTADQDRQFGRRRGQRLADEPALGLVHPDRRNRSRLWRQILALAVFTAIWEVFARLSPGAGVPTCGATVAELGSQLGTASSESLFFPPLACWWTFRFRATRSAPRRCRSSANFAGKSWP